MMKPQGYEEARETGEFAPIELGGHYATIKQVTETQSKTGKPMIVVLIDFCPPDSQAGYHSNAYQNDSRDPKKWPHNGTIYIMVNDYQDDTKTSRNFKTFCTSYEKSNNTSVKWGGSNWNQQFKNKKIGVVYGEEENEYNGQRSMRRVPRWFCSWDKVEGAAIPRAKMLQSSAPVGGPANDSFMNVPAGANEDEGIPF